MVALQLDSILIGKLEEVRDVIADPLVHLAPKVEVMRIKRIVEIEHPTLDMAELTRCWACAGIPCRIHAEIVLVTSEFHDTVEWLVLAFAGTCLNIATPAQTARPLRLVGMPCAAA
jgi:hypothetical protein